MRATAPHPSSPLLLVPTDPGVCLQLSLSGCKGLGSLATPCTDTTELRSSTTVLCSKCHNHSKKMTLNRLYFISKGKGKKNQLNQNPTDHVGAIPVYFPGNDCSVPLRHSGTSSAFLPSALHHLGGCLNSSVQTFSHCLLTALLRAGTAAPRCILKGPHPLHCGSYKEHCYTLAEKINTLSWMKNVMITAVKPAKYSTLFKIRKHQLKDHVQFWASCKKHEQTEKRP